MKVAINGFGRIGRLAFRLMYDLEGVEVVAINDLTDANMLAHLLKYDSTQGRFGKEVIVKEGSFSIDGKEIKVFSDADPKNLPWKELDIDVVLECTGFFVAKEKAQFHIDAGAKRVIISAPGKGDMKTVVYGVNHEILDGTEQILSGASCTTNCLAPMAKVLQDKFGIVTELVTVLEKTVTVEEINNAMKEASSESFGYTEDPIVSTDVIGIKYGSLFDATQTRIVEVDGKQLVKTVAWYDNEMSYTANLIRTFQYLVNLSK